ncbi:MAG: thermonuclease family protein [Chloroflexota bacterium]|nr:thermonuclease family protein [Chloroflexota bacterium]
MEMTLYHYRALVQSVYDGDTCTVDIDLGLGCWVRGEKVRLYRINAPELRGAERAQGLLSRDFLRRHIDGTEVLLHTVKDRKGKFGRYLADIWKRGDDGTWTNVNDLMVQEGYAVYKDY